MKKLLFVCIASAIACTTAFGADGATLYKKCSVCHGAKAEKKYLNKVPALVSLDAKERLAAMKAYKSGELGKGKFNMGGIMKGQMAPLSEADMMAINDYISSLK